MTLQQLIDQASWYNLETTLLNTYPEARQSLVAYKKVYQTLLFLPRATTDLQICIDRKTEPETGETIVDVAGRRQTPHISAAQLSMSYSLQFTPWAEWLSMPVAPKSFRSFSAEEIVVHCLHEMTAKGFDEASIQQKAQYLCDEPGEINASENNNGGFFFDWEQVIRYLDQK